ncbi:uncharacterized protein LOC129226454 [Uloborus diversus]|uniref:uncharacterized protein LOC129226454 n=1 Tax=Uloborus diversus TaxID=327109 RepID=UPI0024093BE3|nr:uncharacterized protein LOC129226454 [Uloborus diversus]
MIMEFVVLATSLLRLFLVSAVYLLNIRALLRLTWRPRACVHALTTGAVLLVSLLYLSSWAPYIAYTLANGHWLLLSARRHCLLQYFAAAEIGAVLLALLAVRLMHRCLVRVFGRPAPSACVASLVTCLAWLAPQLLYDAVAVTRDDDATRSPDAYRFLDDLLVVPPQVGSNNSSSHGYRVGFMICMQLLSGPVLSYYVWQYLMMVLPLAGLVLYCTARLMMASHVRGRQEPAEGSLEASGGGRFGFLSWSRRRSVCPYGCRNNTFVDMALYYNFIWLVLLRPLALLHALYMQSGDWEHPCFYMDFGSHLVLAFSAVFSPFSVGKPPQEGSLTETINTVLVNNELPHPDVCPPIPPSHALKRVESYENIPSPVALKGKEQLGEESVC